MLESVLKHVCKDVAYLAGVFCGAGFGEVGVVDPLGQWRDVADGAELFEPVDYMVVGEWMGTDVNFADDSDSGFSRDAAAFDGVEVVGNGRHQLAHLLQGAAIFNRFDPLH